MVSVSVIYIYNCFYTSLFLFLEWGHILGSILFVFQVDKRLITCKSRCWLEVGFIIYRNNKISWL